MLQKIRKNTLENLEKYSPKFLPANSGQYSDYGESGEFNGSGKFSDSGETGYFVEM